MCGLFGAIRCSDPVHARMVSNVVLALGKESEERGTDSSGLAMIVADTGRRAVTKIGKENVDTNVEGLDHTFIVKGEGKFSNLDLAPYHEVILQPTVFLGHTRWATQGSTKDLANASPLYAGGLIATHNGDIEPSSVPNASKIQKETLGDTDSEVLFRALDKEKADRRGMTKILRTVNGRAALAFFDRSRPDRMYLARTGIAPLSYAYDQYGNFYYGSNPDWFRRIARKNPEVEFGELTLIPEGHLLTISTLTGEVEDTRRFTPIVRESDVRMMSIVAYRGFIPGDKEIDLTLHRHTVVVPPLPKWPTPASVSVKPAAKTSSNGTTVTTYSSIDSYWKSRETKTTSKMEERFAASESEVWDDEDIDWSRLRDADDSSDDIPSDADADEFLGKYDPALEAAYDLIDWDAVEGLCETGDDFDAVLFEAIVTASELEAMRMINELKHKRAEEAAARAEAEAEEHIHEAYLRIDWDAVQELCTYEDVLDEELLDGIRNEESEGKALLAIANLYDDREIHREMTEAMERSFARD